jgi:hypothetical protein
MSYILDALKRAERERNVTRVPTLTTIHPSALRVRRRTGVWLVGGVLLVGAGASLWMLRSSPNVVPPAEMESRARIGGTPHRRERRGLSPHPNRRSLSGPRPLPLWQPCLQARALGLSEKLSGRPAARFL